MEEIKKERTFADEMDILADTLQVVTAQLADSCESIEQGTCCAVIGTAAERYRQAAAKLRSYQTK